MTITKISDREIALQAQLSAITADRDEYQQAADKMAWDHKVERDALTQRVAELEQEVARQNNHIKYIGNDALRSENHILSQQLAEAQKDAEMYRNALNSAAKSLDTIAMLGGIKEYGKPPVATYLETFLEVRGYAKNRAMVAFAAMGGSA
jgi:hypothetical protein